MLKSIFTTSLAGIVAFHVAAAIADPVSDQHPEDAGKLMIVDSLPFFSALFGANDAAAQVDAFLK